MTRRLILGRFAREEGVLAATGEARRLGFPVVDVYTPYPVHGVDKAMGLAPSRLGILCFALGLAGAVLKMGFQYWTHAVDWPLNLGGRPLNSWPAYVPVTFEVMVLMSGLGTVLAFFLLSRLYPGKQPLGPDAGATDDRFVLVIEAKGAASDPADVLALYRACGAESVAEQEERDAPPSDGTGWRIFRWGLAAALVLVVLLNLSVGGDPGVPNVDFLPGMLEHVSYPSYATHPDLPGGMVMQPALKGTIARGQIPLHYAATPEDAERAGRELFSPIPVKDPELRRRGGRVFENHCAVCHGAGGMGDGPVTRRGVPPPPPLMNERATRMPEGQIFHVLTYGQGNMASYAGQLSPEDRWAAVSHVMGLQGR